MADTILQFSNRSGLNEVLTLRETKPLFVCLRGSIDYISNERKSRRYVSEERCTLSVSGG